MNNEDYPISPISPILGGKPGNQYSQRNAPSLFDAMSSAAKRTLSSIANSLPDPSKMSTDDLIGLADNLGGIAPLAGAIKAFHGSPHKFSKFSDEAIGSGEGAQAFGMGHYSGENLSALDSHYRKRLTREVEINSPMRASNAWYNENPEKFESLKKITASELPSNVEPGIASLMTTQKIQNSYRDVLNNARPKSDDVVGNNLFDSISDLLKRQNSNKGYMYELNLKPNQEDLVHFNKTIEEHPKAVQDRLNSALDVEDIYQMEGELFAQGNNPMGDIIGDMQNYYGKQEAMDMLKKAGIPGHSFPGNSGKGAPNYVIYDPENIEILKRVKGGLDSPSPRARKHLLDYI
jgi:hypothetical protein